MSLYQMSYWDRHAEFLTFQRARAALIVAGRRLDGEAGALLVSIGQTGDLWRLNHDGTPLETACPDFRMEALADLSRGDLYHLMLDAEQFADRLAPSNAVDKEADRWLAVIRKGDRLARRIERVDITRWEAFWHERAGQRKAVEAEVAASA